MNPYHVLGVPQDANLETLKAAYRRLARENHPDGAQDEATRQTATVRMSAINAAWHIVSDPQQRASVDARLRLESAANAFRERGTRPPPPPAPTPQPARPASSRKKSSSHSGRGTSKTRATRASQVAAAASNATRRPGTANPNTVRLAKLSSQAKVAEAQRLFHEQGRTEAAMKLCLSVLRTDVRSVSARELLSEIYVAQGQPHRAFALLEQALMLQPTNATLVRKLNQLSLQSGRLGAASTPQPVVGRPVPVPLKKSRSATPSFQISSRAVSVKHSVLGALWAYLLRRTGGGK